MRLSWIAIAACVSCEKSEPPEDTPKPDPRLALDLPQVTTGYDRFADAPLTLTAGDTAIVVDGTSIVPLRNGAVDPQELDGGALGLKITKLTAFTKARMRKEAVATDRPDRAALLFDRDYPYRLLVSVIYSMKTEDTGLKRYDFVAKANGALVSIPIVLPDKARASSVRVGRRQPGSDLGAQIDAIRGGKPTVAVGGAEPDAIDDGPMPDPDDEPIGLFVSIMKDRIVLWSVSGLEGTLRDPRHTYKLGEPDAMKKLNADLTEIANRRWGHKPKRPPGTTAIVVQADGPTPLQTIAEVFGAVRKTAKGGDLFPDIQLSSGFE